MLLQLYRLERDRRELERRDEALFRAATACLAPSTASAAAASASALLLSSLSSSSWLPSTRRSGAAAAAAAAVAAAAASTAARSLLPALAPHEMRAVDAAALLRAVAFSQC